MPVCPECSAEQGKRIWHRSLRLCPIKGRVRSKAAIELQPLPPQAGPAPPEGVAKPIDETKGAPGPAKPPEKSGLVKFLTRATEPIRQDGPKPRQEFDWTLPEEANARLWTSALSFARQCLNLLNKFLGMPPLPDDLLRFGKADIDSINEAFRTPTSKLLYTMGFRTVEQAVRFTLVFSGFSLFGLMLVQLGLFYAENLPKATKLQAWREKIQKRTAEFRARTEAERAARAAANNRPALAAPAG